MKIASGNVNSVCDCLDLPLSPLRLLLLGGQGKHVGDIGLGNHVQVEAGGRDVAVA